MSYSTHMCTFTTGNKLIGDDCGEVSHRTPLHSQASRSNKLTCARVAEFTADESSEKVRGSPVFAFFLPFLHRDGLLKKTKGPKLHFSCLLISDSRNTPT